MSVLKANGLVIQISPDNLPDATPASKGGVKQGLGIAKCVELEQSFARTVNEIIDVLRGASLLQNDKYRVLYHANFPADYLSEGDYDEYDDWDKRGIPSDDSVYSTGDRAVLKFETGEKDDRPRIEGYDFIGWNRNKNATTPEFTCEAYEEGTEQSVTFADNDIVLYAIWRERQVTLTYALGEYGTGSVPSPQTGREGGRIEISFTPAPTVNDGSGRVFVGWAYDDGIQNIDNANYSIDGQDVAYIYNDTTLYPVFCAQRTLTYALGSDATGTVPSAQTAFNGRSVQIDFNPSVTCISDNTKEFVGWTTIDGGGYAEYRANGTNEIWMEEDVTLYPVFASQKLLIDNTNGKSKIQIWNDTEGGEEPIVEVEAGSSYNLSFNLDNSYGITFHWDSGNTGAPIFSGVYRGSPYSETTCTVGTEYNEYTILPPDATGSSDGSWEFYSGDGGTLTFGSGGGAMSEGVLRIDNTNGDGHIQIWNDKESEDSPILDVGQKSIDFNFENETTYGIVYDPDSPTKSALVFSGVYQGNPYQGTTCAVGSDYNENAIISPSGESNGSWYFHPGDGGTLTFGSPSDRLLIDNQAGSGYVSIIDGSTYETLKTIEHDSSDTFSYKPDHNYKIRVHGVSDQPIVQYTGVFNGKNYAEQELPVNKGSSEGESYYDALNPDDGEYIQFSSGLQSIRVTEQITDSYKITIENPDEGGAGSDVQLVDHTNSDSIVLTVNKGSTLSYNLDPEHEYYITRLDGGFGAIYTGEYNGKSYDKMGVSTDTDDLVINGSNYYYLRNPDGGSLWSKFNSGSHTIVTVEM